MAPAVTGSQMLSHSAFLDNLLSLHAAEIQLPVELCMGRGKVKTKSGIKTKVATHVCEGKKTHTGNHRRTDDLSSVTLLIQCCSHLSGKRRPLM